MSDIIKPTKPYTFVGGGGNYAKANEVNDDFDTIYNKINEIIDSLNALRGTAATPDARIDFGHNEDGSHKSGIIGGAEYISTVTPTYVNATTFTVVGDKTSTFLSVRRLEIILTAPTTVYSEVSSSSYSAGTGLTTIVIADSVLTSSLSAVNVSVMRPRKDNGGMSIKMITPDGGDINVSDSIDSKTTDYTFIAAQLTGRVKASNYGATGQVNFIFPTAAANYRTSLKVVEAQYVNFVPEVTDSVFIGGTTLSPYTTGTVTTTNGSAVVTGSGTTWTTNAKAGDSFRANGGGLYIIQSVNSNTQITLTSAHSGSLSGVTYGIGKSVACKVPGFEFEIEAYAPNKWTIRGVGVQPSFMARKTSNQALTTGAYTVVTFVEQNDNNNEYASDNWLPALPGNYDVGYALNFDGAITQFNEGHLYKNGSSLPEAKSIYYPTGSGSIGVVQCHLPIQITTAADTGTGFQVRYYCNVSSGNLYASYNGIVFYAVRRPD